MTSIPFKESKGVWLQGWASQGKTFGKVAAPPAGGRMTLQATYPVEQRKRGGRNKKPFGVSQGSLRQFLAIQRRRERKHYRDTWAHVQGQVGPF